MSSDRLQLQRFELKYIVPNRITPMVREFVRPYLTLDEHGVGKPDFAYEIHSVYLDSDDLALYRDTIQGIKNRYKLRLRFYSDQDDAPVFCEIKRRSNEAILKKRAAVHRHVVEELLSGCMPRSEHLLSDELIQLAALQRFSELILLLRAKPKTHVAYFREAWLNLADNSVRVTIDRDVRSEPEPVLRMRTQMEAPVLVFGVNSVVEIKFTGRFPDWLRELVQVLNLERCSAAKYVEGVSLLGAHRLRPTTATWESAAPRSDTVRREASDAVEDEA